MARVRAPRLEDDGGWIGVDQLDLVALRGRVVLLDFWTLCCVNCLRVAEELRGLERRWAEELLVLGVHSPKFPHERDHGAVRMAVARHRIEHPVLDDPELATWDQYAVRVWPTLVLVDPEGYEVARWSGEGHAVAISAAIEALVEEHDARGTLRRGRLAAGELWVADTFNDRLRVWRGGHLWTVPVSAEAFDEPGGVAVLPGGGLAVADTGNHRVVLVDPVAATATRLDVGRPGSVDEAAPVVAETVVLPAGGRLEVELDLALEGDDLDAAGGPPVRVLLEADPPELLRGPCEWTARALPFRASLPLGDKPGASGRITVELRASTCGPDACRLRRTQRAYDLVLA